MTEARLPAASAPSAAGRLDAPALAALYDRHGSLAYGLALRLTGDAGRAEEVVCEAFVRLARTLELAHDGEGARRRVVAAVASCAMRSNRLHRPPALAAPVGLPVAFPSVLTQRQARSR